MQSYEEIENSIGGRPPKADRKLRLTFYINHFERQAIKDICSEEDISISYLMRRLLVKYMVQLQKRKIQS